MTLTMWSRADNEGYLPELIDQFNASHSDIKVELTLVPSNDVVQKYSVAATNDSGPDIVSVEIGTLPQFTTTGWLQDITDWVDGLDYRQALSPAHLEQAAVGESLYGVPLSADVSVLYWNKALFEQAGLDPDKAPATWDEIHEAAKAVTALGDDNYGYFFSGGCAGCMAFTGLPYVWAQGSDVFDNSGVEAVATFAGNQGIEDALEFYRSLDRDGLIPQTARTENGADQFGAFFSGKIGMFVQGTFPYAELKQSYPDVDFGLAVVPSKDGSTGASYVGGDDLALTAKAPTEAGLEVLRWLTTEGQQSLADKGILPIRSDLAEGDYVDLDPRNVVFVEALKVGHSPKASKCSAVLFDNTGPFGQLIQTGIFTDGSIPDALTEAQTTAEAALR
ncbi:MAG: sugar ABC transporter substrate-binding protein [Bifidobacteriaceae bacterium]|nr:sugar ABC transporter substrate-binding protein [Bifidobacteriaceae bacterium]